MENLIPPLGYRRRYSAKEVAERKMTDAQHSNVKRWTRNAVLVEFGIFTAIFLVSLIWRFNENFTVEKIAIWHGFFGFVSLLTGYVYYQCELNSIAVKQVLHATTEHVTKNDGCWPQTWRQLEDYAGEDSDLDWASSRVTMNFDADPKSLILQEPREFDSIKYKTPCFVPNREIAELQNAILETEKHL